MENTEIASVLTSMLAALPGVRVGKHLNHTNFLVGEKVFAFMQGDHVVMKLPKARIEQIIGTMDAAFLLRGKRVMKEWVVIGHISPQDFSDDLALFKESISFVSSAASLK